MSRSRVSGRIILSASTSGIGHISRSFERAAGS